MATTLRYRQRSLYGLPTLLALCAAASAALLDWPPLAEQRPEPRIFSDCWQRLSHRFLAPRRVVRRHRLS